MPSRASGALDLTLHVEEENRLVGPVNKSTNGDPRLHHQLWQVVMRQPLDVAHPFLDESRPVIYVDALEIRQRVTLDERRQPARLAGYSPSSLL